MVEVIPELDPELEPEAVIVVRALPEVGKIAILAVALGMILAIDAIVRGFFGTATGVFAWIPWLGSVIQQPIHKVEQKIISFLGGIEADIDRALGHAIHQTAKLAEQLWKTLENTALELMLIGFLAAGFTAAVLLPKLERFVHTVIRKVEEEIRRIERKVIRQGAHITRVTVHNIWPRIKGAEVSIKRVVEHEIAPIRHTAHEAERIAVRTEKQVRALRHRVSNKALRAVVAAAIGTVALDALKCVNFGNLFKKRGCNMWNDLESLLGLFADVLIFTNVCVILDFLSPLVSEIAAPIVVALTDVGAGLCRGTIGPPPTLAVPALHVPPNPGFTLDLP